MMEPKTIPVHKRRHRQRLNACQNVNQQNLRRFAFFLLFQFNISIGNLFPLFNWVTRFVTSPNLFVFFLFLRYFDFGFFCCCFIYLIQRASHALYILHWSASDDMAKKNREQIIVWHKITTHDVVNGCGGTHSSTEIKKNGNQQRKNFFMRNILNTNYTRKINFTFIALSICFDIFRFETHHPRRSFVFLFFLPRSRKTPFTATTSWNMIFNLFVLVIVDKPPVYRKTFGVYIWWFRFDA